MTEPSAGAPMRETVATFTGYADAQRAVDRLADSRFPVETVQIVGTDLRMVEQVYGRLDWGRAAAMGAAGGAWFGLLVGLLLGLFADRAGGVAVLLLWGLVWGAVFGALFGVVGYAMTGGRRDFLSRSQIVPTGYQVTVAAPHAARARELLSAGAASAAAPPAPPAPGATPGPGASSTSPR